jgi:hypothetical protein
MKAMQSYWKQIRVLFLFLTIVISVGACQSSESQRKNMAYIQCKDHVKSRLISPGSAEFSFLEFSAAAAGKNAYAVQSTVDAQNQLGVKMRSKWVCRIQYKGGEEADPRSWSLIQLVLN